MLFILQVRFGDLQFNLLIFVETKSLHCLVVFLASFKYYLFGFIKLRSTQFCLIFSKLSM